MKSPELIAQGFGFPEGPVILPDGALIVVDIRAGTVVKIAVSGACELVARPGGGPNGAALSPDGKLIVCNNGGYAWADLDGLSIPSGSAADYRSGSIQRIDLDTGACDTILTSVDGRTLSAPNDIVFDQYGGFYFTDTGKHHAHHSDHGRACYVDAAGGARTVAEPLDQPNGVALSPDGRRIYITETVTARLWWWHVDGPGVLRGGETFFGAGGGNFLYSEPGYAYFDSMAVQANGNVCIGRLLNSGVSIVTPEGRVTKAIDLTSIDPAVTNLAFGGEDMCDLYLTASATGCVYRIRTDDPGHPLYSTSTDTIKR